MRRMSEQIQELQGKVRELGGETRRPGCRQASQAVDSNLPVTTISTIKPPATRPAADEMFASPLRLEHLLGPVSP
jgi:hypothetical protein